eukprot:m.38759 g.38759  ORF g.38759 m.38759 type:complete len:225 (+) comp10034_c0_seq1:188-862(+)
MEKTSLLRLQAWTGLGLSVFTTAHTANIVMASFSDALFNETLFALREIYHQPIVEVALMGTLATHVYCGWQLESSRKHSTTDTVSLRTELQRFCGQILAATTTLHVLSFRVLPAMYGSKADFSFIFYFLRRWPVMYYSLLGLLGAAGVTHAVLGVEKSVRYLWSRRLDPAVCNITIVMALPVLAHSLAALGGHVYTAFPGVGLLVARSCVKKFCGSLGIDTGLL